jgi:hypothetical protein
MFSSDPEERAQQIKGQQLAILGYASLKLLWGDCQQNLLNANTTSGKVG